MAGLDLHSWNVALARTDERPNLLLYDRSLLGPVWNDAQARSLLGIASRVYHDSWIRRRAQLHERVRGTVEEFFRPGTLYTLLTLPVLESVSAEDLMEACTDESRRLIMADESSRLYKVSLRAGDELLEELLRDPKRFSPL